MVDDEYSRGKVLLLSTGHLITDIYPGFLAPIVPLLMAKLDFSISEAATLMSTLIIATSLFQPIFGYLSDRIKRIVFIVIGPIIAAFFMSIINLPNSYHLLLLFVFLSGLGVASFHPQAAALTNLRSGTRKGSGMGIFVFGGSIGIGIGSLLISVIVSIGGLRAVHYAIIPGFIISALLYKSFCKERVVKIPEKNNNYSIQTASLILIVLFLLVVIRAIIILGLSAFIPIYLAQRGEAVVYGGITLFLMHSFGAIGGLVGGHLSEKIGEKMVIILSFIVPLPAFSLYLMSSGLISFILVSLGGFFLYSSIPVVIFLGQSTFPNRISTISSMIMGLGWGIAGLTIIGFGAAAEIIGVKTTLFCLVYISGLGFLLTLFLLKFKLNNRNS